MSPRIITTRDGFHQPHTTSLQRERMEGAFEVAREPGVFWHLLGLAFRVVPYLAIAAAVGLIAVHAGRGL